MIQLKVNLTGKAEEGYKELGDITKATDKDIVGDALALLHRAAKETVGGKRIAIFDPELREVTILNLACLSLLE